MEFEALLALAKAAASARMLSEHCEAASVGAALETAAGNVYTGVNIDLPCGLGFCAEQAAAASMVTAGESQVVKMAAYGTKRGIMSPCGRCREFIQLLCDENKDCLVLLPGGEQRRLEELLPFDWRVSARLDEN